MRAAQPDVRARIDAVWDRLSPAERRVAAVVRHDPELLLVGTSGRLAAESGTSKATVSRVVRSLGFQDAAEARQNLMTARGTGLPWVAEDAAHVDQRVVESRNLDAGFASLARADRPRLARRIIRAHRVLVVGERAAHAVALQLRAQLAQVRGDVRVGPAPGQRLGEEIADLDRRDLVVIVTVRRHAAGVDRLVRYCSGTGADVVVLGDPTAAVIAAPAATTILVPVDAPAAFDSMAAMFAVVAAIANDVYEASGPAGRARVDGVARAYDALSELADV
ncbi:DNA-binding MurR/RpiR family transcriptional regulator [Curtobacterium pusillum]|uniref:DNA-binding MurR/RpiR family transcriptional regulator n=1 Tax=Curtobacterium pusillum TaxID=69373 RepID=A0AAW3T807_9MICO|nr:DNA-binding MurR/RpiR family transcriptional regulator [Curtobacterium pusillum]